RGSVKPLIKSVLYFFLFVGEVCLFASSEIEPLKLCVDRSIELENRYRSVLPVGVLSFDRDLQIMLSETTLLKENYHLLKEFSEQVPRGLDRFEKQARAHLVANATEGCEAFYQRLDSRL